MTYKRKNMKFMTYGQKRCHLFCHSVYLYYFCAHKPKTL